VQGQTTSARQAALACSKLGTAGHLGGGVSIRDLPEKKKLTPKLQGEGQDRRLSVPLAARAWDDGRRSVLLWWGGVTTFRRCGV
jgi:hypothetical protein